MNEKRYAVNISTILGISLVLMLFIFVLVSHHHSVGDRIRLNRGPLLSTASSAVERIKPVGQVSVLSAEIQPEPVKNAIATPLPSRDGQEVYQTTCVACHGAGIAGAPKLGDKTQWANRIAKGIETLYASAVNGIQGGTGVMPAKGGYSALSDAEVRAAVDYMVTRSK